MIKVTIYFVDADFSIKQVLSIGSSPRAEPKAVALSTPMHALASRRLLLRKGMSYRPKKIEFAEIFEARGSRGYG